MDLLWSVAGTPRRRDRKNVTQFAAADPFIERGRRMGGGHLDMVWKALREYEAVSAEPISTAAAGTAARLAVDVREFGWIRPLAGDYAYNFSAIAPLYAGDPTSPDAWRDAMARTQRH